MVQIALGDSISYCIPASIFGVSNLKKRRLINRETGRALEILGHAIEYLADQHDHEGSLTKWEQANSNALKILKELNRQIYLECPEIPSFDERAMSLLRRITAPKG